MKAQIIGLLRILRKRKGNCRGSGEAIPSGYSSWDRDPKQPKQIEAEILGILGCRIETEMLSELHTYIESLTDDETGCVKKFLERRRAATDRQSSDRKSTRLNSS